MYNPLNIELPQGYTAFATYGQCTPEIAVVLYWHGEELATALMEVENPADGPEVETAYANAREFARRCALIHATIREQLGDEGLHDAQHGMALGWCYRAVEDDEDRLEIEVRRGAELLLLKNYTLPPAVRAFDARHEDVAALTRTVLQPALDDWQRLCDGDTAFPGTFEAVMNGISLPDFNQDTYCLGAVLQQALPEFVYRLQQQLGKVTGFRVTASRKQNGNHTNVVHLLLLGGGSRTHLLNIRIDGSSLWEKCVGNPQTTTASVADTVGLMALLRLFARIFQVKHSETNGEEFVCWNDHPHIQYLVQHGYIAGDVFPVYVVNDRETTIKKAKSLMLDIAESFYHDCLKKLEFVQDGYYSFWGESGRQEPGENFVSILVVRDGIITGQDRPSLGGPG